MQNDKFESVKENSSDGLLHQAKMKMNTEAEYADEISQRKKNRRKNVMIGVTTCFFLFILAYAVFNENEAHEKEKQIARKSLKILSEDDIEFVADGQDVSKENVHAIVQHNREQAYRIQSLQDDVATLTAHLNEMKTNFFASDIQGQQTKILNLSQEIANKEELLNWFLLNTVVLDEELAHTKKEYRDLQADVLTQFSLDLDTQLELLNEYNPVQAEKLKFIKAVLNQTSQELDRQRLYLQSKDYGQSKHGFSLNREEQWKHSLQDNLKKISNLVRSLHYHLEIHPTLDAESKIDLLNLHDHELAERMGMINTALIDIKKLLGSISVLTETRKAITEKNQSSENRYAFAHRKHLNNRYYLTTIELEEGLLKAKKQLAALQKVSESLPKREIWSKQINQNLDVLSNYIDNVRLEFAKEDILKEKSKVAEIEEKFGKKKRLDNHLVLVGHCVDDCLAKAHKTVSKLHRTVKEEYSKNGFQAIGYLAPLNGEDSIALVYEAYQPANGPKRNSLHVQNMEQREAIQKLKSDLQQFKRENKYLHKKMVDAEQQLMLHASTSQESVKDFSMEAINTNSVRKELEGQLIASDATIRDQQRELENYKAILQTEQLKLQALERQLSHHMTHSISAEQFHAQRPDMPVSGQIHIMPLEEPSMRMGPPMPLMNQASNASAKSMKVKRGAYHSTKITKGPAKPVNSKRISNFVTKKQNVGSQLIAEKAPEQLSPIPLNQTQLFPAQALPVVYSQQSSTAIPTSQPQINPSQNENRVEVIDQWIEYRTQANNSRG